MHGPIFEVPFSENGTPPWREAHLQVKMYKTPQLGTNFWRSDVQKWHTGLAHLQVKTIKNWRVRATFWSSDLEKLRAAVARTTFSSQNVQSTYVLEHFFGIQMPKNYSVSKVVSQSISQLVN